MIPFTSMDILEQSYGASATFLKGREDLNGVDVFKEWRLMMTKKEAKIAIKRCAKIINQKFKGKKFVAVCIMKGAMYLFTKLTEKIVLPHTIYAIESSSYGNLQTQHKVEILSVIQPDKFEGCDVLLFDELYDNGVTMDHVEKEIIVKGHVPKEKIFKCAMFRKDHKTDYPLPDLCPIVLPSVWCTGMGLDDRGEKRNWTCLYACPKKPGIQRVEADKMFESDEVYAKEREKILQQLAHLG